MKAIQLCLLVQLLVYFSLFSIHSVFIYFSLRNFFLLLYQIENWTKTKPNRTEPNWTVYVVGYHIIAWYFSYYLRNIQYLPAKIYWLRKHARLFYVMDITLFGIFAIAGDCNGDGVGVGAAERNSIKPSENNHRCEIVFIRSVNRFTISTEHQSIVRKLRTMWPTANLILQCDNKWIKLVFFRPYLFFPTWFFLSASFFVRIFRAMSIAKVVCHYSKLDLFQFAAGPFSKYSFQFLFLILFPLFVQCSIHYTTLHIYTVCCVLIVFVNDSYYVFGHELQNGRRVYNIYWTTYLTFYLL